MMRFMLSRKQTLALEKAGAGGRQCCLSTGGRCHLLEDQQTCFRLDGEARIVLGLKLREFQRRLKSSSGHVSRYVDFRPQDRRRGRHRATHINEFIEDLYEFYHAEGGSHRITYNPYTDRYAGPFLDFVRTALRICRVDLTDGAIQKRINTVIKGRLLWD